MVPIRHRLVLGLATSIKWSGLYWIAFFGVLSVIWGVLARRGRGAMTVARLHAETWIPSWA